MQKNQQIFEKFFFEILLFACFLQKNSAKIAADCALLARIKVNPPYPLCPPFTAHRPKPVCDFALFLSNKFINVKSGNYS